MASIDDLMAESNDRWAQAVRRSQRIADNGLGEAVKFYYVRYFPTGVIILLATGTAAGILVSGRILADWESNLVFGFFLAVLGVLIGGLVYNAKKVVPAANVGRADVLLSLESRERKHVRRQIAGKAPVDPEHLVVTRAAAVQIRKGLATQLLLAPCYPLVFVPQAMLYFARGDKVLAWLLAISIVVLAIGIVLLVRDFRRAGRFLTRTEVSANSTP